jgi:type I restriction enzyme S subunit
MKDEAPPSWIACNIGDVARDMKKGIYKPASSYVDEGIACLRMYNIHEGKIVWRDIKRMRLSDEEASDYSLVPGDILVNRVNSRELVGKSAIIPCGLEECVFESKNIRLRVEPSAADPHFVNFQLLLGGSRYFTNNAQQVVGMASISQPQLASFPIRLAPLAEQRRIVAVLEAILAKVTSCQVRLAKIPTILRRFRQSVLAAACSGRLTAEWRALNPEGAQFAEPEGNFEHEILDGIPKTWQKTSIGDLVSLVTSGSRGWAKYYSTSGAMFIRAQNINTDRLDLSDIAYVSPPDTAEGRRTRVFQHDLLVTITGANVTKSAMVDTPLEAAFVSQHVAIVRLNTPDFAPFVYRWIVSPSHGRRYLLASAYGQGKPGLNLDNIRDMPIALPSPPEQQEIVRHVDALFAVADQLEARYEQARRHVDRLTQSVLAKAFRGKLVPTEHALAAAEARDYEPAAQLLARIRTIAAPAGSEKKIRRRSRTSRTS